MEDAITEGVWHAVGVEVRAKFRNVAGDHDIIIARTGSSRNCSLMAAGPDLLYALKSLLEITDEPPEADCRCHISAPCNDCVNWAGEREVLAQARAAIAKAEGRT